MNNTVLKVPETCEFVRLSPSYDLIGPVSLFDTTLLIIAPLEEGEEGYSVMFATESEGQSPEMNYFIPSPNFVDDTHSPLYTTAGSEVLRSLEFRGAQHIQPLLQLVELLMGRKTLEVTNIMPNRKERWRYFGLEYVFQ